MAMINMKSKPEMEEKYGEMDHDAPEYPYGLCIHLSTDDLAKLNITTLPEVGSKMMLHANVYVKSTSSYGTQGGGKDTNVDLQITDMEVLPAEGKSDNTAMAAMLYGPQITSNQQP
jgi:hypothetical protein